MRFHNPIILLHEADTKRGGAPLAQLRGECPEDLRDPVFLDGDGQREVILWLRVQAFQLVSLKKIASALLEHAALQSAPQRSTSVVRRLLGRSFPRACGAAGSSGAVASASGTPGSPSRRSSTFSPSSSRIGASATAERAAMELYVPGEILRQRLGFARPATLYVSTSNPGAGMVALELREQVQSPSSDLPVRIRSHLHLFDGLRALSPQPSGCAVPHQPPHRAV